MNIPLEWLNTYLENPLNSRELANALELAGVEVEGIHGATSLDSQIVVGKVIQIEAHPDADKLRLTQVDVGAQKLQIVCGAANLAIDQSVPVARVGATLPDGTRITTAKLRGVESHGMICSAAELGWEDNTAGIMVLTTEAAPGTPVSEALVANDVITTTTAANRWDLNGLVWLAHEAAAHTGQQVQLKSYEHNSDSGDRKASAGELAVRVDTPELVARYQLMKLRVDSSQPTPSWLTQRLEAAGIRPISPVVDVTNYVMLECGQPLHAFDAAKVTLPVTVRTANPGEKLITLDGNTRALDAADLVIADTKGPIGLAGVIGGRDSEVDSTTTEIYLEAASFNGSNLRKTALRHGLRTDASARFERRLPVELAPIALRRAVALLQGVAAAKVVAGPVDHLQTPPESFKVSVRAERINAVLGFQLNPQEITTELTKLRFEVESGSRDGDLMVMVPWWRSDIRNEEDVAEEIIKLVGYDRLPATLPAWKPRAIEFDTTWEPRWRAKATLRSLGLFEIVTYSFISQLQITDLSRNPADFLKLKNPLSSEQAYLRTDLLPSLLRVAERNRTYDRRFGLCEFSKVYQPRRAGELPHEPLHLGVLIRSQSDGYRGAKAVLDRLSRVFNVQVELRLGGVPAGEAHPARSAQLLAGKEVIGWIAQLHPELAAQTKLGGEIGYLEFDWERFIAASRPQPYRPVSRFPAVSRDISVVVDRSVSWQQLRSELTEEQAVFVSDYYGSDLATDHKVVTVRVVFAAPDRTLTDSEADQRVAAIIKRLEKVFQAKIRR